MRARRLRYEVDLLDHASAELGGAGVTEAAINALIEARLNAGLSGDLITSGTVADDRVASTIARDSELGAGGELELDYVENNDGVIHVTAERTDLEVDTASQEWIRGRAIDYDGATRIRIECFCAAVEPDFHKAIQFNLYEELADTTLVDMGSITSSGTGGGSGDVTRSTFPMKGEVYLTPAAGTHRYQIRVWAVSGGSLNRIYCGDGDQPGDQPPPYSVGFYRISVAPPFTP